MIIYKITNIVNGKIYVGLTSVSVQERWTNHKSNARNPAKYTSALYGAIRKYGIENFTIEQIDTARTLEELNIKEQTWIKALCSLSSIGYNLDNGGGAQNCHPETRKKISKKLKGLPIKNRMNGAPKGRPVSLERRAQISASLTGRPRPDKYKPVQLVATGEVFASMNEAADKLNLVRQTIYTMIKDGRIIKL